MKKLKVKKVLIIFFTAALLFFGSAVKVNAQDDSTLYDTSKLYNSLSDEVKQSLNNMGIDGVDTGKLSNLSFSSIIAEITNIASQNVDSPLKGLITIIALLLLCSILSAYKNTLGSDISTAINITSTLCVTCAAAMPAISIISRTSDIISTSSNIMLTYIPIMAVIMAAAGHPISGASYYSMMIAAGEGVGQLSSKIIVPLLNMFLGLSITGCVSPDVNLGGFTNLISRIIKWLLSFAMTIVTAVLTIREIITTSLDNVSTRAVRFTLNSFIPIVGSALSDAYKTVQGSVGLLKSGVGVFVIISIAIVFLPIILQSLMWIITLSIGKSTAEVLNLQQVQKLLESISAVFSTLLAIVLCIMSVYIISTAIILLMGGAGN